MNYAKIIYDLLSPEMAVPVAPMQMAQRQQPPYVVFNVDRITPQLYKGSPEAIDELEVTVMAFDIDLDAAQSNLATVRTALSAVNAPGLIQYSWPDFSGQQYLDDVKLYVAEQVFVLRIAHRAGAVTLAGALNLLASASVSINVPAFLQGGLALALGATGSITRTARLEAALSMNASTALTFSTTLAGDLLLNASADNILTVAKLLASSIQLNATTTAAATISRLLAGDITLNATGSAVVDVTGSAWSPAELTSLVFWFDPADATQVTTASGLITQVTDKSGNGYTVSQASGSKQPEYVSAAINGLNVARWTNDALVASVPLPISTALSVFAVSSAPNSDVRIIDQRGSGFLTANNLPGFQLKPKSFNDGLTIVGNSGDYKNVNFNATWTGTNIFSGQADLNDLAAMKVFLNTTDVTQNNNQSGAPSNMTTTQILTLGANSNGQDRQFLTDDLGDVIVCDEVLSQTDREKVEGYLAHKWGLTAKLPSAHPYKNVAP
jgi:hypothetical protein